MPRVCLIAAGWVLAAGQLPAQTVEPIRVEVGLANVAFTVRDAKGALVSDLKQSDFSVFEDSVEQKIAFFARSADVPLMLGLAADFSSSQDAFLKPHHRDLEDFLRAALGPGDLAWLVTFGNRLRLVADGTSSSNAVMEGLKRFEKGSREFRELGPSEIRVLGTAFYDAGYYLIKEKLDGSGAGRRALIMFSDGEDNSSAHHMLDLIEAAQSADVRFYAVRYTESRHGRLTARNKYGTAVMERIARETGGSHFDAGEGDLGAHFRSISEELHSSYELAYHPANKERDGTFRKVVIRVKQPGLTIRAKTGYYAR